MDTAIPRNPDASSGIISWVQNLFLSNATSQFGVVEAENRLAEVVVHRVPNAESLAALNEVANGEVVAFATWDDFFEDLYADDDDDEC